MGRSFDLQEIISTAEAKGMRALPSPRGLIVRTSNLVARRGVGLKSIRSVPIGRVESAGDFMSIKAAAVASSDAARALQLLQADSSKAGVMTSHQSLRLRTEFAGLDDTEITRPDSQIAAGPEHLIVAVNAAWAVFDKAGRQLLQRNFTDMFSPLVDDASIFNPKVIYDQFRNGWVMAACARSIDGRHSWFLLAFSAGGDPLADWWIWALDARFDGGNRTGYWADGLGLSADNTSLFLTANMFSGQGNFVYSKLRILNKKELQSGGILHGWDFWQFRNPDGSSAFGLQPAINVGAPGAQYFLNATPDGHGLTQWTLMQQPRQTPILSRRSVPTIPYQIAPNANQPTTDRKIVTGDTRIGSVIFRHGMLWTAHTIAVNWGEDANVSTIQWLQINPRTSRVVQQGIYGAPHYHYFCPAVMADDQGNMILVFNRAGEMDMPEIRFTGRYATDEPNTLQESALLQQSPAAGGTEWSSFSGAGACLDDSSVWFIGQYSTTENDWATWIGSVSYAGRDDDLSRQTIDQPVYVQ